MDEIMFYGGLAFTGMVIAGCIFSIIFFNKKRKTLNKKFDEEYGKA